jgi:hypothetical protein
MKNIQDAKQRKAYGQAQEYYQAHELLEELETFFADRNSNSWDVRRACINMLLREGEKEGLTEREANEALARFFKHEARRCSLYKRGSHQ